MIDSGQVCKKQREVCMSTQDFIAVSGFRKLAAATKTAGRSRLEFVEHSGNSQVKTEKPSLE